jgi:ABC-type branched-subunit amino acid transport system ATPase component
MITVQCVTKHYGRFTAFDNVTFTAAPGSVTGFLGPNGAGRKHIRTPRHSCASTRIRPSSTSSPTKRASRS